MFYFCLNPLHDFFSRWHLLISVSKNLDPDQAQHSVQIWSGSKLFDTWRLWQVEVEQMYFNFALNLYMTLPSADNPFKWLDPDQAQHSVRTWYGFKLFDALEVMTSWSWTNLFQHALNLCMTLSSADYPFKQFGPRSGLTFCTDLIGVKLFDTLEVMTSWSWTNVF